jgi:hypothetical protein
MSERSEDEKKPEQIAALESAVKALKDFIVSEIQENNAPTDVAMADAGGDLAKAMSAKKMAKVQDVHDHAVALGAACGGTAKADEPQGVAKAAADNDMAKADVIGKLVEDAIAKAVAPLRDELAKAHSEIERMKNLPLPGKALLTAVAKADDGVDSTGSAQPNIIKDASGNPNEVASLIKMIHQHGGVR